MANKFDNPRRATGACGDYRPEWADCDASGTYQECSDACGQQKAVAKRAFQSASGNPEFCRCGLPKQDGKTCEEICKGIGDGATNLTAGNARRGRTPVPCPPPCTAVSFKGGADCPILCGNFNPYTKASGSGRTIRVTPPSANARFMMATGRGKAMSDFLHEVGIIVIGFAAFTYIAQPIFKKVGIKPINI